MRRDVFLMLLVLACFFLFSLSLLALTVTFFLMSI